MKKATNVKDVARLASVSVATVSRAFNQPGLVRDELRETILKAAAHLDYVPNHAARALRSRRTGMVGAVIPTLNYALYAGLVNALQESLHRHGYSLLVAASEFDPRIELAQARLLIDRGAEALALVGASQDPALWELLDGRRIPSVCTYTFKRDPNRRFVGFDNYEAIATALEYLIGLGHTEFAMMPGRTKSNDRQQARVKAFRDGLRRHRLDADRERIFERPYSIEQGGEAMRAILQRWPGVTAVMCSTDVLAFGAVAECRRQGLRVPADLSILGFDNLDIAAHCDPPLTTVDVSAHRMGARAAEVLIASLDGATEPPDQPLETSLVIRNSTGPAPKQLRKPIRKALLRA